MQLTRLQETMLIDHLPSSSLFPSPLPSLLGSSAVWPSGYREDIAGQSYCLRSQRPFSLHCWLRFCGDVCRYVRMSATMTTVLSPW